MEFVFLKFDPDKTGCIDGEEMYELMEEVDPSISRSEIDQLRKSLEKSSYVDLVRDDATGIHGYEEHCSTKWKSTY